jgi:hypothetical protein
LYSLKIHIKVWPKHRRVLDYLESLAAHPLPPILTLKYSLDKCSYKTKVIECWRGRERRRGGEREKIEGRGERREKTNEKTLLKAWTHLPF